MAQTAPSREVKLTFAQIAPPPGSMALRGVNPNGGIEFGMRSDEVASKAVLNLEYTPSPSLLPVQSQLKVYLNDELMGVLPVTKEQLGKKTLAQVPINPLFITDFNRVRLEFVGHYRDVCENPASSTLWLDIGRNSALDLTYNMLAVNNDLSHFPVPFFDPRDNRPVTLPIVFADMPDLAQQQAASIVASWFGSRAGWRGQRFPVLYNHLPDRNAIVFATNDRRPDFLRDHPAVNAPVIEMMSHPDNPYVKLLVVFGRDDKDLLQAAKGIAQGNILFRGSSVVVNDVKPLLARKPYDAPNWVRTDRPVTFGELKTYEEQLQSSGLEPAPINVSLNLPPDLYLLRSNGIDMDLNYRYTSPPTKDSSRLDISLNNQFLQAFSLNSTQETNRLLLRLPVLQGLLDGKTDVSIPALKLGAMNQLRFDFRYMNPMPGGSVDNCITFQPVPNHVVIGDDSTIDFSKYYHFIAMPDLRAFANAGFPFSRFGAPWSTLRETNLRLLLETAPKGFSPDWVRYESKQGWQLKAEKTLISSYDAIRVYLWAGMMHDGDPQKARLLARFKPMATLTMKNGVPPEKVDVVSGNAQGTGPVGFSAALLPFLQNRDAQAVQRQRVADHFPGSDAYYNYVLTLFGQGWDQHRFRFTVKGELLPDWGQECVSSR